MIIAIHSKDTIPVAIVDLEMYVSNLITKIISLIEPFNKADRGKK